MTTTPTQLDFSIVVTSRNDNHGGDLTTRTQVFIDSLYAQCDRHKVHAELIFVEWNPPADRQPIQKEMSWPNSEYLHTRIVHVPPEEHLKIDHGDRLPLFQMIGKNVGIRRSVGKFVLATNVDLIFSDGIFERFATMSLDKDTIYIASRFDVSADLPADASIEALLKHCEQNVLRENLADGLYDRAANKWQWRRPPNYQRKIELVAAIAMNYSGAAIDFIRLGGGTDGGRTMSRQHLQRELLYERRMKLAKLHTNACGDFTLASRKIWDRMKGYAEMPMFSMHLDSLFLITAAHAGIRQHSLPNSAPVYHIEHGSGWSFEGEEAMNKRIDERGVPRLSFDELREIDFQLGSGETREFADDNWGLHNVDLKETVIGRETNDAAEY